MAKRSTESPMDFEWQTRAPGDATSPFYQLGMQHDNNQKKRPYGVFDSPTKIKSPSRSFVFSQSPPPQRAGSPSRPDAIFGKPAFSTPRKFDLDFSSGAENASSPENLADNEGTPEPALPAKREKRNSLFGLYGRFAPSPGRGEIPRMINNYATAQARRVHKRRRRERDLDRCLRRDSDYESDRPSSSEGGKSGDQQKEKQSDGAPVAPVRASWYSSFSDFFTLLEDHPNVPRILSYWLQLAVNVGVFLFVVWIVGAFVMSIRNDINQASALRTEEIEAEKRECSDQYLVNRCQADQRPPALQAACSNWERCMSQDSSHVGHATVSVQTISLILSGFVDNISWKAFSFFLSTIVTVTVASNWTFIAFRNQLNKKDYDHNPYHHIPQQPHPYQDAGHFGLEYPRTPGRNAETSPMRRQRSFEYKDEPPLMIENTPSRQMDYVTGRSQEREQHVRTPSPSKRDRRFY